MAAWWNDIKNTIQTTSLQPTFKYWALANGARVAMQGVAGNISTNRDLIQIIEESILNLLIVSAR